MMKQCGCELGGDCTRVSVCAVEAMVEEYDDRLKELEARIERVKALLVNWDKDCDRLEGKDGFECMTELQQALEDSD